MKKLGIDPLAINAYLAVNGTLPATVAAAITTVASQEFIALFLNPEAWVVWRRTGAPALQTTVTGSNIPRRLLYPQTEINFNGDNVPSNVTVYSPLLFWDN
jgi:Starch-binding associating with outer membrane